MSLPERTGDSTDQECCDVLAMLVRLFDPWEIYEAGTHTGHSALAMAGALRGSSRLLTADPSDMGVDFGSAPVDYYHGTFEDMMNRGSVSSAVKCMAFIDASGPGHDNRLRWKHYQLCRDLGIGLIVVHDTAVGGWAGPHTDWEDVLPLILEASDYNLRVGRGLSITIR